LAKKRRKRRDRRPNIPQVSLPDAPAAGGEGERTSLKSDGFNPDYSYVIKDLKRIAVLAGGFIILLIVLSIFLR
jgi:hypothetical protein